MKWHDRFAGDSPNSSGYYIVLCFMDHRSRRDNDAPLEVYVMYYDEYSGWENTRRDRIVYYWQEIG